MPSALAAEGVVVVLTVLIVPVMLYVGNLAAHGRILYPVTNFLLAGYLFARRSPWYAGHCLLLFCFVSLVRRLIDEQAGWDPSNPVLLTPYLCCVFTVISFFGYWSQRYPRYIGAFLALLLCIAYGTVMAVLHGRIFGALVDALKWSIGPLFAVYVIAHRDKLSEMRAVVEPCLIWAGAAMAAYGVVQFIDPQPWDATWMRNVAQLGLDSIGQPEPFAVRVFSTTNSPGSLAIILCAGIIVGLKRRLPVSALTVTLMIVGLALCQYRNIWAATFLGIVMVAFSQGAALRPANVLALLAIGFSLCSTAIVPRVREAIVQRATTLTALKGDESLKSRLDQYAALARDENLLEGGGLAINGASRRLDNEMPVHMDGALIEIWRALGVVVGTVFLLSIAVLAGSLFCLAPSLGVHVFFDRAVVVATFILFPMGSVHAGELGFCAWMFLGFSLATRSSQS